MEQECAIRQSGAEAICFSELTCLSDGRKRESEALRAPNTALKATPQEPEREREALSSAL